MYDSWGQDHPSFRGATNFINKGKHIAWVHTNAPLSTPDMPSYHRHRHGKVNRLTLFQKTSVKSQKMLNHNISYFSLKVFSCTNN